MRAQENGSVANFIAPLDYGVQGQGYSLVELSDGLARPGRCHRWDVTRVIGREESLQHRWRSRSRVLKWCRAIPLRQTGLPMDSRLCRDMLADGLLQELNKGLDGLQTAVVWAGEDPLDWWLDFDQIAS